MNRFQRSLLILLIVAFTGLGLGCGGAGGIICWFFTTNDCEETDNSSRRTVNVGRSQPDTVTTPVDFYNRTPYAVQLQQKVGASPFAPAETLQMDGFRKTDVVTAAADAKATPMVYATYRVTFPAGTLNPRTPITRTFTKPITLGNPHAFYLVIRNGQPQLIDTPPGSS